MHSQESSPEQRVIVEDGWENQGYDWSVKVVWVDGFGNKQRSKGRLLLAHKRGIMIREELRSGRPTQKSISARSIIKLKYRSGSSPASGALAGAANGLLNGNPLPIATGNPYVDLLAAALSGALFGLANNSSGSQRTVWVNRNSNIYRERVLPDLGFAGTTAAGTRD